MENHPLTRNVMKKPFWTSAPSTLLHSCDMPGLSAVKLFTFNSAHVFGDVNETNVCKYIANVKLSECVSFETIEEKLIQMTYTTLFNGMNSGYAMFTQLPGFNFSMQVQHL